MFTINVKCYDVKSHKITERVPKQKEASLKIVLLFVACYEIESPAIRRKDRPAFARQKVRAPAFQLKTPAKWRSL